MNSSLLPAIAQFTQNFISGIIMLKRMGGMVLEGIVTPGLGRGAFFMSIDYYKKELKKKLGFGAYPGTLNLKVAKEQIIQLKKLNPIKIDDHKEKDKTFYGANCYKSKISNINGAIIIPDKTQHKNIIEFIAPVNLKSQLKIKDGDKVKIELMG